LRARHTLSLGSSSDSKNKQLATSTKSEVRAKEQKRETSWSQLKVDHLKIREMDNGYMKG